MFNKGDHSFIYNDILQIKTNLVPIKNMLTIKHIFSQCINLFLLSNYKIDNFNLSQNYLFVHQIFCWHKSLNPEYVECLFCLMREFQLKLMLLQMGGKELTPKSERDWYIGSITLQQTATEGGFCTVRQRVFRTLNSRLSLPRLYLLCVFAFCLKANISFIM